jgi:membrane protease YdiL (CAAX protease family)
MTTSSTSRQRHTAIFADPGSAKHAADRLRRTRNSEPPAETTRSGNDRRTVGGWIRRYPIVAFVAWFFTVGWAFVFVPAIARSAWGLDLPMQPFIVMSTVFGLLLPALVITHVVDGPDGVRQLLRSALHWRAALSWYLVALVAVPATAMAIAVAMFGPPDAPLSTVAIMVVGGLLLQTAIGAFTNNLWEEVAWMGFVQARLHARHGALMAAALTTPLFTLQHLPLFVDAGAWALAILGLAMLIMFPNRVLLGWVHNRTGSLLLVGLLHASGNAVANGSGWGSGVLARLYPGQDVSMLHLIAGVVLGLAVIAATRRRRTKGGALSDIQVTGRSPRRGDGVSDRGLELVAREGADGLE